MSHTPPPRDIAEFTAHWRDWLFFFWKSTQADWIAPTLENAWADYGGDWTLSGYRKIGDIVYLRGLVDSTSA